MHTTNLITETASRPRLNWVAALSALALLIGGSFQSSLAQKSGPETFSSPGKATSALFQAVQNSDEEALERILGADKEVTSSNDEIEDKLERERFGQKYQEMHRLVQEPDGRTVLYIGAENWPFPIPLVSKNGAWHFDSDSGKQEILFRTVGENETTAIQVCHVLAQAAQAKERSDTETTGADPITQYAQNLVRGGPANADNAARDTDSQSSPFHGYYFRMVTENSAAGSNNRVSGSRKTGALSLVAYPADYRSSGVMTFIVTKNGIVYEKDLGSKTPTVAKDLKRGPDSSWHTAE
ncbi:MAG TPA: DUF2950 family protein [Terriglobales bacterium]|nr:DUF2950 family protein [Terriglobales bacterium]